MAEQITKSVHDDCILYKEGTLTKGGYCTGLKELLCATSIRPCPFYKSNKDYYSDGRPRKR